MVGLQRRIDGIDRATLKRVRRGRAGMIDITDVSREVIEAFSTRRSQIQASMNQRGWGDPGANPSVAERPALMTSSYKREMDREALRDSWHRQPADLDFDARELTPEAA